jgi:hypothetical protein
MGVDASATWYIVSVAILVTTEIIASLLCATFLAVKDRRVAIVGIFINLISMGGTWGAISMVVFDDHAAFAVTEIFCFMLMGFKWRTGYHLGLRWLTITLGCIGVLFLYKPMFVAIAFGVLFALFQRSSVTSPSAIIADILLAKTWQTSKESHKRCALLGEDTPVGFPNTRSKIIGH